MAVTDTENLGILEFLLIFSKDTALSLGKDRFFISGIWHIHTFLGITLTRHPTGGGKRDDFRDNLKQWMFL